MSTGTSLTYNPYTKTYSSKTAKKSNKFSHRPFLTYSSANNNDDQWIGDTMPPIPDRDHTRFWLQNCNGMITASDINKYMFEMQQYVKLVSTLRICIRLTKLSMALHNL